MCVSPSPGRFVRRWRRAPCGCRTRALLGYQERDDRMRPRGREDEADDAEQRRGHEKRSKQPHHPVNHALHRHEPEWRLCRSVVHGGCHRRSQAVGVVGARPHEQRHVFGAPRIDREIDAAGIDPIGQRTVGHILCHADDLDATTWERPVKTPRGAVGDVECLPKRVEPRPQCLRRRFADHHERCPRGCLSRRERSPSQDPDVEKPKRPGRHAHIADVFRDVGG